MHPTGKEFRSCPYCKTPDARLLFEAQPGPGGRLGGVVRCKNCRLIYRNLLTTAEENRKHYEQDYYPEHLPEDWIQSRKILFRAYTERLEAFRQTGRILDVGAGHGFFLEQVRQQGWEVSGVELSEQAVRYAKEELNLDLFHGALEEAGFPDKHFDVVTLWNVLDQTTQPLEMLKEIFRLLRPGGAVFIRTPNATFHVPCRRFFRAGSQVWKGFRRLDPSAFQHCVFDKNTLRRFLRKAGFQDRILILNSRLCWTHNRLEKNSFSREFTAALVSGFAQAVLTFSLGSLLVAPTLFGLAVRQQAE
jgi:2-polyprenyl-3-methyl-5-hydroxy-6-metoxy-1,4-benzoquinol methylase